MRSLKTNSRRTYRWKPCFLAFLLAAVCGSFLCFPVNASPAGQQPAAEQTGTGTSLSSVRQGMILTRLAGQGRTVTLTVKLAKDSQVSSGRIKIYYPSELLNVTDVQGGKLWALEDINTAVAESGQDMVSYAWADTEKFTGEGNLLTVVWEAKEAANRKEIVVETEVAEVYSKEERLTVTPDWIMDRLRPDFASGNPVRTGDETNAAGFALLCWGAALVMARLVRSKKYG